MPFVNLNIAYHYQSSGGAKTGSIPQAKRMLQEASRYIQPLPAQPTPLMLHCTIKFSTQQITRLAIFPTQATTQVIIICPSETCTLTLSVTTRTNSKCTYRTSGVIKWIILFCYNRQQWFSYNPSYFWNVPRKSLQRQHFNQRNKRQSSAAVQQQIRCTLYGIQLSVTVVDFFGTPISNANVTLNGPEKVSASYPKATEPQHSTTSSAATCK